MKLEKPTTRKGETNRIFALEHFTFDTKGEFGRRGLLEQ